MGVMTRTEDDWQQQLDEVVALASILDADFTLTAGPEVSGDIEQDISALTLASPCSEQLECTAAVRVAFPSGVMTIRDTLQPSSSTAGAAQSGWPVQHLPPILLRLSLPSTYPSEQPPDAHINATWLTSHQVQQLQQHLLDMWNAASGLPICYTWVDWLQQDALAYLGISDTLDLSQFAAPGISNTHDQVATTSPDILNSSQPSPKAHSGHHKEHDGQYHHAELCEPCQNQSAETVLTDLLRFDAAEKLRAFHRGTWTCGICFEQFPGRSCVQASLQCGHVYCQSCMAQQCALHVKEGNLEFLRCPEPDCKEPLDRQMVKSVLSDEQNNRLEAVELERTLNHMMDAVYCPRCSTFSLEDEDNCAQCSNCFFAFCSLCNESWHPGTKCLSPEDKLELMRRRMAGTKSGDREFRKREAELQNLAHIEKNCKQCPACGMAIERSEGCNKMTCTSCGVFFCYRCNQQIDGYKHYWNGNCILFDLSEIERWEAEMGQHMMGVPEEQRRGADAAARPAVKSCRCPRCGRIAYKEGNNNNMRCPACTANFWRDCLADNPRAVCTSTAVASHLRSSQGARRTAVDEPTMATAEETRILRTAPSTSDLPEQARDVTKPGAVQARTKPMKLTEAMGNAPYLWNPVFNRGTAFSEKERRDRRIEGLLPPVVESIELQAARVMEQIQSESEPLEKFIILNALQSTNEALFYHVIIKNLEELAPVIYTPTVGEACQKYDRIFRQPLGMYFSAFRHKGRFYEIMKNWPSHNVQIIVVTDGGRILGLGDLGTNGMGIPVGKIALYVAGGGFHPDHSLPAQLDCGTDTEKLLNDKFYLGSKEKRLTGDEHMEVVEEFCAAAQHCFPNCLIQFEDFQTNQAFAILEKMRNKYLCFNDDIQGTGGVVTAGFINGLKAQGTKTKDAKVLFYGAGSSAVGVANMIATLIQKEGGLSEKEAKEHIYMIDSKGLVTTTRGDKLPEHKTVMARKDGTPDMKDLVDIVKHVKPHAVVGLTGGGEAWGQEMIEEMCKHVEKPLVFPLSNPTSQAEITAENAYKYSKGKCIFAGGSPFDPVEYEGKKLVPGQANNVFIFPGVGFGSVMIKAKTVTDDMFIAAAKGLADYVSKEQIEAGNIYPEINDLRNISATVAAAVANAAYDTGNSNLKQKPKDMLSYIKSKMWVPGKSEIDNHEHDDITNHKIEQDVKEARQP